MNTLILKKIMTNRISQREIALELGVSLGKINKEVSILKKKWIY